MTKKDSLTYCKINIGENVMVSSQYVVENLQVCKICINTHTHTHTHTFSPPIPRALIYSFPVKLQSGARTFLQALSCVYVAANIYSLIINSVIC